MSRESHGPSCAKRLRREAAGRETVHETARKIPIHCSASPLRAQRLAQGTTLQEAADKLSALGKGRALGFWHG